MHLSMHMYLWLYSPFLDLGRYFSYIYTRSVGFLGREMSPSQGRYLYTEQQNHRISAHRHRRLERDWNPRSQPSCERRDRAATMIWNPFIYNQKNKQHFKNHFFIIRGRLESRDRLFFTHKTCSYKYILYMCKNQKYFKIRTLDDEIVARIG
jgi:hypothetical protein